MSQGPSGVGTQGRVGASVPRNSAQQPDRTAASKHPEPPLVLSI